MNSQRTIIYLAAGAIAMVAAVFGALHFAGGLSGGNDVPERAMSKADVEKIVRNYLLENPDILVEVMNRLQSREDDQRLVKMKEKGKAHSQELYAEADPIVAGNPKGDITVVEFFDYHCPYCKKVKKTVADLLKQDGNIRLVLREFPILSAESQMAAEAAVASVAQGRYWDFHMALMGADDLSPESIFATAKKVGLDVERLKTDMKNPAVAKRLATTQDLARAIGIDATPTFFIGDEPFTGAQTLDELKAAVAAARKARPS